MSPKPPADDRHASPLTAATQALTDATAALGEALRAATTETADTVENELTQGLRSAARTVESMAAKLSGRGSRRDRTRQDLLAAATTVFAARGYDGASVDDVAAAAGYTKGAVYSHFSSKAELFLALFRARVEAARADPLGAAVTTLDALDDADLTASLDRARRDPWLPLTYEVLLFGMRHPEHREEVAQVWSELLEVTVDALAQRRSPAGSADAAGSVPDPAERAALRDAVIVSTAVAHHLAMLNALGVTGADDETVLRLVRGHWPAPPRDGTHQGATGH